MKREISIFGEECHQCCQFVILEILKTTWLCTIKLIISFQFSLFLWFNFRNQSNHVKNFFSPTRIYYSAMLKARISCFQNHDSQVFFSYDLYKIKKVGGKYSCMRQRQRQMWWYCVTNWFIYMTKQNSVIRVIYLFNIITQFIEMFTSSLNNKIYWNTTANWIYKLLHR